MDYIGYNRAYEVYIDIQRALIGKIKAMLHEMLDQISSMPLEEEYQLRFSTTLKLLWGTLDNCIQLFEGDIEDGSKYWHRKSGGTV